MKNTQLVLAVAWLDNGWSSNYLSVTLDMGKNLLMTSNKHFCDPRVFFLHYLIFKI